MKISSFNKFLNELYIEKLKTYNHFHEGEINQLKKYDFNVNGNIAIGENDNITIKIEKELDKNHRNIFYWEIKSNNNEIEEGYEYSLYDTITEISRNLSKLDI